MSFLARRVKRKHSPIPRKTRVSRCAKCKILVDLLPLGMSHRCYTCTASVCTDCVYPYRLFPNHNAVVFCGQRCCDTWVGKRKAEQLAEATAEDIGSEDSSRSSSSSSEGSIGEFVVPDNITDVEEGELSEEWDSEEQYEWAQYFLK